MLCESFFVDCIILFFSRSDICLTNYIVEYKSLLNGNFRFVANLCLPVSCAAKIQISTRKSIKIIVVISAISTIKESCQIGKHTVIICIKLNLRKLLEVRFFESLIPECILYRSLYLAVTLCVKLLFNKILILFNKVFSLVLCKIISRNL